MGLAFGSGPHGDRLTSAAGNGLLDFVHAGGNALYQEPEEHEEDKEPGCPRHGGTALRKFVATVRTLRAISRLFVFQSACRAFAVGCHWTEVALLVRHCGPDRVRIRGLYPSGFRLMLLPETLTVTNGRERAFTRAYSRVGDLLPS